jgi:hypothetical protein
MGTFTSPQAVTQSSSPHEEGWKDLLNLNRWASDYLPMGTYPQAVTQSSSPHIGVRKIC